MLNPQMLLNMVSQLQGNPLQMLSKSGLNVPQNISNNPEQLVKHLINSGQVKQETLNQAMQIANSMGIKL